MERKVEELSDALERLRGRPNWARELNSSAQFTKILQDFYAKPQELDSSLKSMFDLLFEQICNDFRQQRLESVGSFICCYQLLILKSLPCCFQYLPNDISLLGKILTFPINDDAMQLTAEKLSGQGFDINFFTEQDIRNEICFVVLSCLEVLALTPLAISTIGDFLPAISRLCAGASASGNKCSENAMETLARFVIRVDLVESFGETELQNYIALLGDQKSSVNIIISVFELFTFCIKYASDDVKQYLVFPDDETVFHLFTHNNALLQKAILIYCSKRAQSMLNKTFRQVGLSLLDELKGFGVPEAFDLYIDILLESLQSESQDNRQIAAIMISELCSKLPRMFFNEIFDVILELLQPGESAERQSGTLLCIGEMIRLQLVEDIQIGSILSIVLNGLKETVKNSNMIKDSACYCLWAFARSYSDSQLAAFANVIEGNILAVACLDPDIMIRRAAAASYEELCGRHHEIFLCSVESSSLLDFYSIGNYANSCELVGSLVELIPALNDAFTDYLLIYVIAHDNNVRRQCGRAMAQLNCDFHALEKAMLETENWLELLGCLELYKNVDQRQEVEFVEELYQKKCLFEDQPDAKYAFIESLAELMRGMPNSDFKLQFTRENVEFCIHQLFTNVSVASTVRQFTCEIIKLGQTEGLRYFDFGNMKLSNLVNLEFCDQGFLAAGTEEVIYYLKHYIAAHIEPQYLQERIMMLETISHIKGIFTDENRHDVLEIIVPCLEDYSIDTRGDIGAQTRMKAFFTLSELATRLDVRLQYLHYFIEECCSRIQLLRIQAIKQLFNDANQGKITLSISLEALDEYTGLATLNEQSEGFDGYFNLAEKDDDEKALFYQQIDYLILQNSFLLLKALFFGSEFRTHCLEQLILCFGKSTLADEQQILALFSEIEFREFYKIVITTLKNPGQGTCISNLKLSAIELLAELIYDQREGLGIIALSDIPFIFNVFKLKAVELLHILSISEILSYIYENSSSNVKEQSLMGLKMFLYAKIPKWREISLSQFRFLREKSLQLLCLFDFEEESVYNCKEFVEEFSFE